MNKKKILIIIVLICSFTLNIYLVDKVQGKKVLEDKVVDVIQGTYVSQTGAKTLMMSIDSSNQTYHCYDGHNEIFDVKNIEGTYVKLDEESMLLTSGKLVGNIVVVCKEKAKLIYSFDDGKSYHTVDLRKRDTNIAIVEDEE